MKVSEKILAELKEIKNRLQKIEKQLNLDSSKKKVENYEKKQVPETIDKEKSETHPLVEKFINPTTYEYRQQSYPYPQQNLQKSLEKSPSGWGPKWNEQQAWFKEQGFSGWREWEHQLDEKEVQALIDSWNGIHPNTGKKKTEKQLRQTAIKHLFKKKSGIS